MRIYKALKRITKIKGELSDLNKRIQSANVALEDNQFCEDIYELTNKYHFKRDALIDIKARIMKSNVEGNMYEKILKMSELKSEAAMIRELSTREGKHTANGYGDSTVLTYRCQINLAERNRLVEDIELKIESIRDELDDFNATRSI